MAVRYCCTYNSCGSIAEAHALLTREQIDLMVLDIELPEMNGLDFLGTLRDLPLTFMVKAWAGHALEGFRFGSDGLPVKINRHAGFTRNVCIGVHFS